MVVTRQSVLPWIAICSGLLVAAYYESRAFFIGFAAAAVYMAALFPIIRDKRRLLFISVVFLAGLLSFLIFFVKSDSSRGRMLIYKISSQMFREHGLRGMGSGAFKTNYLHYQADYFQKGNYSQQELLLADNTYFAFNDYWQFIIEYGLLGILLLGVMGLLLIRAVARLPIEKKRQPLYSIAAVPLIAIATAACFSHVFEKPLVQFVFLNCVLIFGLAHLRLHVKKRTLLYIVCSFLLAGGVLFKAYGHQWVHPKAYQHWEESKVLRRAGFLTESLEHCALAAPSLNRRGRFLAYHGQQLLNARRFQEAKDVLNHTLDYRIHHRIYLQLGTCYGEMGDRDKAEQAFLTAVHMVPNRFASRFALFNYYQKTGQIDKARSCGYKLLYLPVKVPSIRVDQIRSSVASAMKGFKKS